MFGDFAGESFSVKTFVISAAAATMDDTEVAGGCGAEEGSCSAADATLERGSASSGSDSGTWTDNGVRLGQAVLRPDGEDVSRGRSLASMRPLLSFDGLCRLASWRIGREGNGFSESPAVRAGDGFPESGRYTSQSWRKVEVDRQHRTSSWWDDIAAISLRALCSFLASLTFFSADATRSATRELHCGREGADLGVTVRLGSGSLE